jgi:hypothetical protein
LTFTKRTFSNDYFCNHEKLDFFRGNTEKAAGAGIGAAAKIYRKARAAQKATGSAPLLKLKYTGGALKFAHTNGAVSILSGSTTLSKLLLTKSNPSASVAYPVKSPPFRSDLDPDI